MKADLHSWEFLGIPRNSQEFPESWEFISQGIGGVLTDGDAVQVDQLLERFSSWHSLKKFVAWFLR